jgi:hypothetical protein
MTLCHTLLIETSLILCFLGSWHRKDLIFFLEACLHFFVKLVLLVVVVFTVGAPGRCRQKNTGDGYQVLSNVDG